MTNGLFSADLIRQERWGDSPRLGRMEPTLSNSTNTNEDSNSDLVEEDDIDMQSPLGTPVSYAPLSPVFPSEKFAGVWQNLKRHPSWTIQPGNTADCIAATASIVDDQLA